MLSKNDKELLNKPTVTQAKESDRYGSKTHLITWAAHLRTYAIYSEIYGRSQSAERLAQRGGFGEQELDAFYPEWRNHITKS